MMPRTRFDIIPSRCRDIYSLGHVVNKYCERVLCLFTNLFIDDVRAIKDSSKINVSSSLFPPMYHIVPEAPVSLIRNKNNRTVPGCITRACCITASSRTFNNRGRHYLVQPPCTSHSAYLYI